MPNDEPTADAWCYTVSNSPLNPSDVPNGSQTPPPPDRAKKIRHSIGRCADALQRALDALPDEGASFIRFDYFAQQLRVVRNCLPDAMNEAVDLEKESVVLDGQAAGDGEPSTADLLPFPKIEDAGKGGAA